jgi:hypothetical protein
MWATKLHTNANGCAYLLEVEASNLLCELLDAIAKDKVVVELTTLAQVGRHAEEHLALTKSNVE